MAKTTPTHRSAKRKARAPTPKRNQSGIPKTAKPTKLKDSPAPALQDDEEDIFVSGYAAYEKRVGRTPLLDAQGEVELGTAVAIGRRATEILGDPEGLLEYEFHDLSEKAEQARKARADMLLANQRLAMKWARKYAVYGIMELEDLQQEAMIGLSRATELYDYTQGNKFSTYAVHWMRQAMTRAIANKSRAVRLPAHVRDKISSILRTQHSLSVELHRRPTLAELALEVDTEESQVDMLLKVWEQGGKVLSLDAPLGDDFTLFDVIADKRQDSFTDGVERAETENDIDRILEEFSNIETRIMRLRFGLGGEDAKSLEEVAELLGVTRLDVRRAESGVLKKLRSPKYKSILGAHFYKH